MTYSRSAEFQGFAVEKPPGTGPFLERIRLFRHDGAKNQGEAAGLRTRYRQIVPDFEKWRSFDPITPQLLFVPRFPVDIGRVDGPIGSQPKWLLPS